MYQILYYLCLLCIGILGVSAATVSSQHYKVAVGQGECSTTVSTISEGAEKLVVGVTADVGTSSYKSDPKYITRYNYSSFKTVFSTKQDILQTTDDIPFPQGRIVKRDKEDHRAESSTDRSLSRESDGDASHTGEGSLKTSFEHLWEQIREVDIWIVFLSHPDKDHINKISEGFSKLKPSTKVILIAGGEWFNSNSTEDIREVFSLIQQNPTRIFSFFPYEEARPSTEKIEEILKDEAQPVTKKTSTSFNPKKLVNGIDSENIAGETFGELFHTPNLPMKKGFYSHKRADFWRFLSLSHDKEQLFYYNILAKIRIWSLDHRPVNTNAQSLVWSHEVDDLGWTFVYTGDAEDSTFKKIQDSLHTSGGKQNNVLSGNNLVMMQVMHHGSEENISERAFDLFAPNACAISAGNGASFPHPHINVIEHIRKKIINKRFWKKYNIASIHHFAAFQTKGDGKTGKAVKVKIKPDHPAILCPNISGTIKISSEGISVPFNQDQTGYFMHDNHHAYELEKTKQDISSIIISKKIAHTLYGIHPKELQGKEFRQDTADETLYTVDGFTQYKLKRIEKEKSSKQYYYFYILERLEDDV